MEFITLAERIGISAVALERLLAGHVPEVIADRIGATAQGLQRFVDGDTSTALAARLQCTDITIQRLRETLGREGAIGLLVGLVVPTSARERKGE